MSDGTDTKPLACSLLQTVLTAEVQQGAAQQEVAPMEFTTKQNLSRTHADEDVRAVWVLGPGVGSEEEGSQCRLGLEMQTQRHTAARAAQLRLA